MLLSPSRNTTAADLLRLAAAWLAVILALQCANAAWAATGGMLHRHVSGPSGHAHAGPQRHFHAADQAQIPVGDADEAALALAAAMALMAIGRGLGRLGARAQPVWRAALAWVPLDISTAPPRRPPRRT